jgi:hypothetical protein
MRGSGRALLEGAVASTDHEEDFEDAGHLLGGDQAECVELMRAARLKRLADSREEESAQTREDAEPKAMDTTIEMEVQVQALHTSDEAKAPEIEMSRDEPIESLSAGLTPVGDTTVIKEQPLAAQKDAVMGDQPAVMQDDKYTGMEQNLPREESFGTNVQVGWPDAWGPRISPDETHRHFVCCPICSMRFGSERYLSIHIFDAHDEPRTVTADTTLEVGGKSVNFLGELYAMGFGEEATHALDATGWSSVEAALHHLLSGAAASTAVQQHQEVPPNPAQDVQAKLSLALDRLLAATANDPDACALALETLHTYFINALHSSSDKYRKINLHNPAFCKRLGSGLIFFCDEDACQYMKVDMMVQGRR